MQNIYMYLLGGGAVLFFLRFSRKSLRLFFRLFINFVSGGILLMLLNRFGRDAGIYIAQNPVTAFLIGVLGLPGVLALLFIKLWL